MENKAVKVLKEAKAAMVRLVTQENQEQMVVSEKLVNLAQKAKKVFRENMETLAKLGNPATLVYRAKLVFKAYQVSVAIVVKEENLVP